MPKEIDVKQALAMAEVAGVDVAALARLTEREDKVRLVLSWLEGIDPADTPRFVLLWSVIIGIAANALTAAGADPMESLRGAMAGLTVLRAEQAAKVPRA